MNKCESARTAGHVPADCKACSSSLPGGKGHRFPAARVPGFPGHIGTHTVKQWEAARKHALTFGGDAAVAAPRGV